MELTVQFGEEVRRTRKSLNLTQDQLAYMAGINCSHMGQIERGQKSPSLLTIGRIAKALRCSPATLINDVII